jgi:hypothetical protein
MSSNVKLFQVAILHSVPVTHLGGNTSVHDTRTYTACVYGYVMHLFMHLFMHLYASLCGNLCGIFHLMAASDKNHWLFRNTRRHCARPLTIPVLQEVPGISLSLDVNIEHIATHLKTITSFGHPKAIAIPYHLHIDTFPSAAS